MTLYLGLLIHMGLVRFPKLIYHWYQNDLYSCNICPRVMKRDEFRQISSFLHISDNRNSNLNDKLYKVRPLLNLLVKKWQHYYVLGKIICLDERMMKYKGRVSFKQYNPAKPTRWGIKAFV